MSFYCAFQESQKLESQTKLRQYNATVEEEGNTNVVVLYDEKTCKVCWMKLYENGSHFTDYANLFAYIYTFIQVFI